MGTRTDLRGFLNGSQKKSGDDEPLPSCAQSNEFPVRIRGRKECDELVKHMSKLPGFLQGDESNVLNVGVLDWARLEQWKHGRARRACEGKTERKVKASRDLQEPELASSLNKPTTCRYKSCGIDQERAKIPGRPPSSSGLLSRMGNLVARDKETEKSASLKQCNVEEEKTASLTCENHQASNNTLLLRSSKQSRNNTLSSPLSFASEDMMLPLLAKKVPSGGTTRHENNSTSKRFSFSFGRRLSTSFTFKEDSSATIKSDSMRYIFDGLAFPSQSSNPEEKHGGSLRRLLDPLLKSSENVLPSTSKRSASSNPKPASKEVPLQDESRTRALFQLTIRNGIPLFQFVVDDRSILGATMQRSASSFKHDSVRYCTFYSFSEVKKKKSGSWLIHGHKEKQQQPHSFVYNVIGQMRLCNSSVMRESVLVDETEQVKGRKEVAAVVIKKQPAQENFTTVIIPGGVHSIPEKGAPTPLISRWRSGGCCDCGGWDVGCKLHVLSNKTFLHDLNLDQTFKLFHQEESDENTGPVLAMTELETGIYRVEFGSFLSHLQAFFVCVTVITCAPEEETVSKTTGRSSSPFAPPLSPVGRA